MSTDYANEPVQSRVEYLLQQAGSSVDPDTVRAIVRDELTSLIDGAPGSMDTFKEVSDWIDAHEDWIETISDLVSKQVAASITGSSNLPTDAAVKTYVDDAIDELGDASEKDVATTISGSANLPTDAAVKAYVDDLVKWTKYSA